MWAVESQGRVSLFFFLTRNTWLLHKHHLIPNTQWVNHSQLTFDTVSAEFVLTPQVEASVLSWLQMSAVCSRVTHALDQVTKSGSFHDLTSMLNNNRTGERTQEDSYCLRLMYGIKLRNHEMEEMFRAKEEWRWAEPPRPGEHRTLTSPPLVSTS